MIKRLFFTALLLVPGLAYGGNPSADLSVQVTPAGSDDTILPKPPAGYHWVQTFADEFNGNSLDTTAWPPDSQDHYCEATHTNPCDQGLGASGATVSNGFLHLAVDYALGERIILKSWPAFYQQYGYFVYNARFPLNDSGQWSNAEADLELFLYDPNGVSTSCCVPGEQLFGYTTPPAGPINVLQAYVSDLNFADHHVNFSTPNLSAVFHQFGFYWINDGSNRGSGKYNYYFDGVAQTADFQLNHQDWHAAPPIGAYFDIFFAGSGSGDSSATLDIDWVRAYQLVPDNGPTPPPPAAAAGFTDVGDQFRFHDPNPKRKPVN